MFVFPLIATLISLVFSGLLLRQYVQRQKPHQLAWAIALLMFSIGALAETLATINGWSEVLVKIYYLFGGTLVVGYLGLGTLYVSGDYDAGSPLATFLLGRRFNVLASALFTFSLWLMILGIEMFQNNIGVALIVTLLYLAIIATALFAKEEVATVYFIILLIATVLATLAVTQGDIDPAGLSETAGWHALDRTLVIRTGAFSLNVIGSFILIIGALQSAIGLLRKHVMKERAIGNILIALGVLVVAGGGTIGGLLGLGGQAAISVPMAFGITIMFLGFLRADKPAGRPRAKHSKSAQTN